MRTRWTFVTAVLAGGVVTGACGSGSGGGGGGGGGSGAGGSGAGGSGAGGSASSHGSASPSSASSASSSSSSKSSSGSVADAGGAGTCTGTVSGGVTGALSPCVYTGAADLGGAGYFLFRFNVEGTSGAGEMAINTEGAFAVGDYTEGSNLWNGIVCAAGCATPPNYASSLCEFTDEPGTGPTEISLTCVGPLSVAGQSLDPACTGGKLTVTKVDPPTTAPHSTELWNYLHGTFDMTWPAETGAPQDGIGASVTVHIDF